MNVVIIGAGVAGLAIGWRLRQAGASVLILDRGQAGLGATWAAAGMIAASSEMADAPAPEAEFAQRSQQTWPTFAREVEEASGIDVGYRQSGALMVALTAEEAADHAARAKADPELKVLTPHEARAMEPMLSVLKSALWDPREAQVDNRALGRALTAAFMRAGGTLSCNEAVVRIVVHEDRAVSVHTPVAIHHADAFVLAAGAWSGLIDGLPPYAVPPVKPMKGEMLALVPHAGTRLPDHVVWGNGVYLVPRAGRLLIGATLEDAGFDTSLTDAAEDWLSSRAIGLMPSLRQWKIDEHWAGLRPGSPDGLPLLGPTTVPNLFVASGQYRNGILFAPAIGDLLSRLVLGRPEGFEAFDPRRFR
ncbi:MAG TPA: glycine oxidase ThiO, partial [Bryobacteraceae bacterium]